MKMILISISFSLFLFITPSSCYLRDGGRTLRTAATNRMIKSSVQNTLANWREIQLEVEEAHRRLGDVTNPTVSEALVTRMRQTAEEGMDTLINTMAAVEDAEPYQADGDEPNKDLLGILESGMVDLKKYEFALTRYLSAAEEVGIENFEKINDDAKDLGKFMMRESVEVTKAKLAISNSQDNMNTLLGLRTNAERIFGQSLKVLVDLGGADDNISRRLDDEYDNECFSPEATVEVLEKGKVAMKDLAVGDKVLTRDASYEAVYMFGHLDRIKKVEFLQIFTDDKQHPLEATCNHFVHVMGHGKKKARLATFCELEVGDILHGSKNEPRVITKIGKVFRDGFYAPLTPSGTIVVDSIFVSTYSSLLEYDVYEGVGSFNTLFLSEEQLIHISISPLRLLCIGVSPILINYYTEDGKAWFVNLGVYLSTFYCSNALVHIVLLSIAVFVCFPSYAFELVFGAARSPLVLLVCVMAGIITRRHTSRFGSFSGTKKVKIV